MAESTNLRRGSNRSAELDYTTWKQEMIRNWEILRASGRDFELGAGMIRCRWRIQTKVIIFSDNGRSCRVISKQVRSDLPNDATVTTLHHTSGSHVTPH